MQAANAIIEKNHQRLGKNLWTDLGEGELIDIYDASDEYDEASFIANYLQQWHRTIDEATGDKKLKDIAILYRSNAQSRALEEVMIRNKIPYQIYGGQRFYERLEIKNVIAYLRLLVNVDDDNALERIINVPPRGIGARSVEKIREHARAMNQSLWQAMSSIVQRNIFGTKAHHALEKFMLLVQSLKGASVQLALHELVEEVIERTGIKQFHVAEGGERGAARVENIEELVSACHHFSAADDGVLPLVQFLAAASLDAGDQQADANQDAVQMMTLHSAKGLEFPLVILAGVENNLFPHMMAEQEGNHEEERRLCYVGITRAMRKLLISYAQSRRLHGQERYNGASTFVREIPQHLSRGVRLGHNETISPNHSLLESTGNIVAHDDLLSIGQLVKHPVFGTGIILNYEGSGEHLRVEVNFEGEGNMWLIYVYARLSPV